MNGLVNQQRNDAGLRELALFAGAGGGILGGHLLGWRTVCAVEYNAYARSVLLARQNDGTLAPFPIWDDVRTFDGKPWRGLVDVVSGGFPCQDISPIGLRAGIDGEQSGLWGDMARIISEVLPRYVLVENSSHLVGNGLARVLSDLAKLGFDAQWGVIGADDVGADHERKRLFLVANSQEISGIHESDSKKTTERLSYYRSTWQASPWHEAEPKVRRMDDGLAFGVERFEAIGNGRFSEVAATAWRILSE